MSVSLTVGVDSVTPSAPRELFPLPAVDTGRHRYAVAADGQRFLVRAVPQSQSPQRLNVIVGWPEFVRN